MSPWISMSVLQSMNRSSPCSVAESDAPPPLIYYRNWHFNFTLLPLKRNQGCNKAPLIKMLSDMRYW